MLTNNSKTIFLAFATLTSLKGVNINGAETSASYGFSTSQAQSIIAFCGGYMADPTTAYGSLGGGISLLNVGFGDTPETAGDYILADGNDANPLLKVVARSKNVAALGEICNVYVNVRNDGSSNVTVKEIGLYGNPTYSGSSGGSNTCLLARKVLETPVTIAPGETYSFNYVLRFKS